MMKSREEILEMLQKKNGPNIDEHIYLLDGVNDSEFVNYVKEKAVNVRKEIYGRDVYIRGLIEYTNICKNNCYYCGIRKDNKNADRYRLTKEQILECTDTGYRLGFRTFVLQGGEDSYFNDERVADIVSSIKKKYPDCAITLSMGERGYDSFRRLKEAGADRYLLRHETADEEHYQSLHPKEMSYKRRMENLYQLKELGYQVGCGFMVGSPGQKNYHLAHDLKFIKEFIPDMVGIGPFIPHKDTRYAGENPGTLEMTTYLLAIIRLMLPKVLLPATTALGTIDPMGREKGLMAGANVVMPNLSPKDVRKAYQLYDNKICTGEEAAECIACLKGRVERAGYEIVVARGDVKK